MKKMKKIFAAACAVLLLVPVAGRAERADALKPINIEYNSIFADNASQNTIATGNVIITRGTMVLKSDRAEVKESPEGYRTFILTAAPGKLATFRQKRDGGPDLWAEGHAQRIEYDERADVIKLFTNAKEVLLGRNDASGADKPGQGRGSMTFEPSRKAAASAAAPATPAAPAASTAPAAGKQ